MYTQIRKRDGRLVPFDSSKITTAILKAGKATGEFGEELASQLSSKAVSLALKVFEQGPITVEDVQDIVEEILIASPYRRTAKAYIIYREQHARLREISNQMDIELVDQYLERADWKIHENSNMDYSLQGLNNYISSEISKIYWLNKIYPREIKKCHLNGEFHIHDLSLLSVYCVGWDLYDLLIEGFKGVSGKVEARPANHLRSALGQIANFFYTLQGEAAGAQAFSNFDTLLAPFIRYDKLDYREVKQALQEFVFNINVPTRVGFQTPFTNVTLDMEVPSYYLEKNVIVGGKPRAEKYGDFQKEMDIFNRAFLEVMVAGDSKGRVFTFPIPTYSITANFDWDDEKYIYLWEATAKYGVPYFSNFVNSSMNPEDARSMCCRLRIDNRELEAKGGGLFGSNPLTGSIGVVTINMPRLAHLAESEPDFFKRLERLMELASQSLEIKRKLLEKYTDSDLYPYTRYYLRHMKQRFNSYWKNHFSTIGLVGMNEACLNFIGEDIASSAGQEFSKKTLDFMREKLIKLQSQTGNNYNLEATPAEGTSYRLATLDSKDFPEMPCFKEHTDGEVFYTNSTQLPVNYTDDVFEALDLQDEIQTRYTGGTVFHIFAGERVDNPLSIKTLVRRVCENYHLPYFTFSPTFSVCPNHGYTEGEHSFCPKCGQECEVFSRIVGYLRPVTQWNKGKQEEFKLRREFAVS